MSITCTFLILTVVFKDVWLEKNWCGNSSFSIEYKCFWCLLFRTFFFKKEERCFLWL